VAIIVRIAEDIYDHMIGEILGAAIDETNGQFNFGHIMIGQSYQATKRQ